MSNKSSSFQEPVILNLQSKGLNSFEPVYKLISEFFNEKQRPNIEEIDASNNDMKDFIELDKIGTRITTVTNLNVLDNLNFKSVQMAVR